MGNFSTMNIWELGKQAWLDKSSRQEIDNYMCDKIINMDDLLMVYHFLCAPGLEQSMPKTRQKINSLLSSGNFESVSQFKNLYAWFDSNINEKLLDGWLNGEDLGQYVDIFNINQDSVNNNFKIFERLLDICKSNKSQDYIKLIEKLFIGLDEVHVDKACQLLSKLSPSISFILLKRKNIKEKYLIKGLKSLSKLSKQRDLDIKIDINSLEYLGPRARLDTMKQLLGISKLYLNNSHCRKAFYSPSKNHLPFDPIPDKSELEKFLFPCSLKYNEEVKTLLGRFDELMMSLMPKNYYIK